MIGIMSGFGIHINQLSREDVETYQLDLGDFAHEDCIAVHGEDMVRELAYVIAVRPRPVLVWQNTDVRRIGGVTAQYAFAAGIVSLARTVLPELDDLLKASRHESL